MEHRVGARRFASTALSIGVIGALVVGIAVLARDETSTLTGERAVAGTWVVNEATGMLGRADLSTRRISPAMPIGAAHVDIVQSSNTALLVDREAVVASVVDAATLDRSPEVSLPSGDTHVVLAMVEEGDASDALMDVALLSPVDGDLWIVPVPDFSGFDADEPPAFSFGAGASLAVGEGGALFVASPRDGSVYEVGRDGAEPVGTFAPFAASRATPVQVSIDRAGWRVLDPQKNRLITADGVVDLGRDAGALALQTTLSAGAFGTRSASSGHDGGEAAFVASQTGLVEASVSRVRSRVRARAEAPARPIRVGDCVYGAWDADTRAVDCEVPSNPVLASPVLASPVLANTAAWAPAPDLRPVLRTDGRTVIANDPASGATWAITAAGAQPFVWVDESDVDALDLSAPNATSGVSHAAPRVHGEARMPVPPPRTEPDAAEPPEPPAAKSAAVTSGRVDAAVDRTAGTVTVSWEAFASDDEPIAGYLVQRLTPGDPSGACSVQAGRAAVAGGDVQSATGTSTLFGGAAPPEDGYRFVVWGYTAEECVAAPPVAVRPDPVPGAVTDPRGAMVWIGTHYDYRIAPGEAARYELRRADAAGAATGSVVPFTGSALPRELTAGPFGEPTRFVLRACTVWGADAACGPWTEHAAPEPSLDFTLADLAYSEEKSEWTWRGLPDNGGQRVKVVGSGGAADQWRNGTLSATATKPVSPADAVLTVRVGGRSMEFSGQFY